MKKTNAIIFNLCLALLFNSSILLAQNSSQLFNTGNDLYKQKKYKEALTYFNQSIDSNLCDYYTHFKKSYTLFRLNDFEEALSSTETAFELKEKDYRYFYLKSQYFDKLKNYELALHYISMAIKFNPNKIAYYNFRAGLNMEMGNYKQAIEDYDIVIAENPDEYGLYLNRGLAEYNLKNKIGACMDWLYARDHNDNCKRMFFFNCEKMDLRPYEFKKVKPKRFAPPLFIHEGDSSVLRYLDKKYTYPEKALFNFEQGTVLISFTIDKKGKIKDIKSLNHISQTLDSASIALALSTEYLWLPAIRNTISVDHNFVLPVKYIIHEPYYVERDLLDSIKVAFENNQPKKEISLIETYLTLNPFNQEMYLRWEDLNKKLENWESKNKPINLAEIDAQFLNEIHGYGYQYKFYFDKDWAFTEKHLAEYFCIANDYILQPGMNTKLKLYSMDSTLYLTGSLFHKKPNGVFKTYYESGQVKLEATIGSQIVIGDILKYWPNGELKHKIETGNNAFYIGEYNDLSGNSLLSDEGYIWQFTNESLGGGEYFSFEGEVNGNEKEGIWKFYYNDNLVCEEEYKNNKFRKGKMIQNNKLIEYETQQIDVGYFIPYFIHALMNIKNSPQLSARTKVHLQSLNPINWSSVVFVYDE